jgi:hypothetical protein
MNTIFILKNSKKLIRDNILHAIYNFRRKNTDSFKFN